MQSVASLSVRNQRPSVTISEIEDTSSAAAESFYKNHWNQRDGASTYKYQKSRQADSSAKMPGHSQRNTSPENFTDGLQEDILFEKIQNVLPSQVPSLRTKYMQPDQDLTVEEDDIKPHINSVIKQKKRQDMARGDSPKAKSFSRTIKQRNLSNQNLLDSDSMEINSRHSESHRVVRASQIKKDTMKRDVAKRQRKYMSQTARRDKQKKRQNFQMWTQILKRLPNGLDSRLKSSTSLNNI